MLVLLILLSIALLCIMIYFAVARTSTRTIRWAAIIALGASALTILICGIIILVGPKEDTVTGPLAIFGDAQPAGGAAFNITDLVVLGILMLIMAIAIYKAFKQQEKTAKTKKARQSAPILQNTDELDVGFETEGFGTADEENLDIKF